MSTIHFSRARSKTTLCGIPYTESPAGTQRRIEITCAACSDLIQGNTYFEYRPRHVDAVQLVTTPFHGARFSESPEWLKELVRTNRLAPVKNRLGKNDYFQLNGIRGEDTAVYVALSDWIVLHENKEVERVSDKTFFETFREMP